MEPLERRRAAKRRGKERERQRREKASLSASEATNATPRVHGRPVAPMPSSSLRRSQLRSVFTSSNPSSFAELSLTDAAIQRSSFLRDLREAPLTATWSEDNTTGYRLDLVALGHVERAAPLLSNTYDEAIASFLRTMGGDLRRLLQLLQSHVFLGGATGSWSGPPPSRGYAGSR